MQEIRITNQSEFDKLSLDFKGRVIITGEIDAIENDYPNAEIHICENANIRVIKGSAQISDVYGSAQIRNVYGSAQISYVYGSANVLFVDGNAKVSTQGNNIVSYWNDKNVIIENNPKTTIVILDRFNATWDAYTSLYPIKTEGEKAIMYKAVNKVDGKYLSNYNSNFEYKIGEVQCEKCDPNQNEECSFGIHISHRMWAINFGRSWDNMALLEVEVDINSIIIPKKCDGKVRANQIKVIREIPKEEWYA